MKSLIKLAVLAALAIPGIAAAECTAATSWSAPTTNTDGSALAKCSNQTATTYCLIGYNAYRGPSATSLPTKVFVNDRNALSYTWTALADGTQFYAVSTVMGDGTESAKSAVGSKTCTTPKVPNAPGNFDVVLTVTVADNKAYKLRQGVGGFTLVQVGTLPVGTICDTSQTINGMYVVPRTAVKMSSSVDPKPAFVVAQCSAS